MTDVYKRSSVVEHDPEYEAPSLQDIEIICVAFDVLHNGKEVSTGMETDQCVDTEPGCCILAPRMNLFAELLLAQT